MRVKFYGTRGSIPVCAPEFQEFGGNTTCVLIEGPKRTVIVDAGTGIRDLGKELDNDPDHDDVFLRAVEQKCRARFPNAVLTREKMEI